MRRGHGRHQRRPHVEAAGRRAVHDLALRGDAQASVARQAEIVRDDLVLALRDQRAEVEIGQRRAHLQRAHALREALHHLVEAAALDQDARAGRAGLPGVLDAGVDEKGQRRVQVGIGEDDLRALAAELERDGHGVFRRRRLHQPPGGHRAGEGEVLHAGMRRERRAGFFAQARHDVERAGRQAALLRDAADGQRRQAGFLGGLQHAGIAHRQRRADAAADDLHRVVPGHHVAGHAMRLAPGERGVAVQVGNRLAAHLVGRAAVELEVARQRHGIGAALLERLADIQRFEAREFVDTLQHRAPHGHQQPAALGGGEPAPLARARRLRGLHGGVHVLGAAACDLGERAAVRRVQQRQALARARFAPAAGDEEFVGGKGKRLAHG